MNPDIFPLSNPIFDLSKKDGYILTSLTDNHELSLSDYLDNLKIHIPDILKTTGTKEIGICLPNEFIEKIPYLFQQNIDLHCFLSNDKILYPLIPDISHFSLILSILGIQLPDSFENETQDIMLLLNTAFIHTGALKITITKNEFNIQFNTIESNTLKSFLKIAIFLSTSYNISNFIIDKTSKNGYESKIFNNLGDTFTYFSSLI